MSGWTCEYLFLKVRDWSSSIKMSEIVRDLF